MFTTAIDFSPRTMLHRVGKCAPVAARSTMTAGPMRLRGRLQAIAVVALLGVSLASFANEAFPVEEASIAQIQAAYLSGKATAREVTQAYLDRIAAYDKRGPYLNALITVNAAALAEADRLDAELKKSGKLTGTSARNSGDSEGQPGHDRHADELGRGAVQRLRPTEGRIHRDPFAGCRRHCYRQGVVVGARHGTRRQHQFRPSWIHT